MHHDRPHRLRRCQLAVPGSNEKMMAKAAETEVDHVFLDLEDAVAPNQKLEARAKVVRAVRQQEWGRKTVCVRVNDLSTPWVLDDLLEVVSEAHERLDTIMVPKVKSAADLHFVDILLGQLELKLGLRRRIGVEILVEEVEAMARLDAILDATTRLEAVVFGMGDYSASQNVDPLAFMGRSAYPGDIWHYHRNSIAIAARARGIDFVDGPYVDLQNAAGYEEECRRALWLGAVGKWALHPSQAEIAMLCFSPDPSAVDYARRLQAAYAEATAAGQGAVRFEGEMIDAASLRVARRTLDFADAITRMSA